MSFSAGHKLRWSILVFLLLYWCVHTAQGECQLRWDASPNNPPLDHYMVYVGADQAAVEQLMVPGVQVPATETRIPCAAIGLDVGKWVAVTAWLANNESPPTPAHQRLAVLPPGATYIINAATGQIVLINQQREQP